MHGIVYTIGHSNHSIEYFLELLKFYNINCLIDVRSIPMSSYSPQYNQGFLKNILFQNNIIYLHFKKEFGARQEYKEVLNDDFQVDFEKVRKTKSFNIGIDRIKKGIKKGYTIALMCSEGNPIECHRFSMISWYLHKIGFTVQHILPNKDLQSHSVLEMELLKKYFKKLQMTFSAELLLNVFPYLEEKHSLFSQIPLFESSFQNKEVSLDIRDKIIESAYRFHNQDVGWKT